MNNSVKLYVESLQGSPVSPILWVIYINQMFKSISLPVQISSYTDDIAIVAASKTLKENCTKL